jgi:hypothetical protein
VRLSKACSASMNAANAFLLRFGNHVHGQVVCHPTLIRAVDFHHAAGHP